MEVTATHYSILIMKYNRVIGHRVDLGLHYIGHSVHYIIGSPVDLRHAAEGVRVLDLLFFLLLYTAACEQLQYSCRACQLPFMRSHAVYRMPERFILGHKGIGRKRADNIGP